MTTGGLVVKCPKCGCENEASATNCADCHVNLKWALENCEQEAERLKREAAETAVREIAPPDAEGKSFAPRVLAYTIDSLLVRLPSLLAVIAVGQTALGVLLAISGYTTAPSLDERLLHLPVRLSIYALSVIYHTLFEWLYGATPGKLILGMRVVKANGEPCGLWPALLRALLRFIDQILFGLVAYVTMKPPLYQRLGDQAAKTIVVDSKATIIQRSRPLWMLLLATVLYLAMLGIMSFLYILFLWSIVSP